MNDNYFKIFPNLTLKKFIHDFEQSILQKKIYTAIKFDKKNRVIGVITRGDIRRLISKKNNFNDKVDKFLNYNPILIKDSELDNNLFSTLEKKSKGKKFDDLIVIDSKKRFLSILRYEALKKNFKYRTTCIVGLGHIGIPLAIHILKKFNKIIGYDNNKNKIQDLKKYRLDFYEKNLDSLFKNKVQSKQLILKSDIKKFLAEVYIICIGSTIIRNKVNNKNLIKIAKDLSKKLKKDDIVILRGTVSVGVSRKIFLKTLLKYSKLKNGSDFYFGYMPERLVEGNALEELENIPCLVAGSTQKCLSIIYDYTKEIFKNVIKLESIEEGEILKLTSNAFRALNFTFSNEISRIANLHNISGSDLIEKANFGYSRNNIAKPSLGLGGFCLPKDPILFSDNIQKNSSFKFGKLINETNNNVISHFANTFSKIFKKEDKTLKKILLMGIAFKGIPETIDLRNSTSLAIMNRINRKDFKFYGYDPMGDRLKNILKNNKIKILSNKFDINSFEMIIIVNDHPNFYTVIENKLKKNRSKKNKYIIDTWNKLDLDFVKNLNWHYIKI